MCAKLEACPSGHGFYYLNQVSFMERLDISTLLPLCYILVFKNCHCYRVLWEALLATQSQATKGASLCSSQKSQGARHAHLALPSDPRVLGRSRGKEQKWVPTSHSSL